MSERAAVEEFKRLFGEDPEVVAISPGRINLIGEHTDYNEGFVFPGAIDKRIYVAAGRTVDSATKLHSLEL
ncbi:MAG: galactokinase, partial [Fimbriimonadaceae bacterium]|nr:galactokinase [Fimbriimonadaceae bacterium]